jgi:A/G-specific adenine glycosylase
VLSFPQKKVKARSPEFDCDMLLIRSGNSVLLQQRPSKAIWGGLWSLPESAWRPKGQKTQKANPSLKELLELTLPEEINPTLSKFFKTPKRGDQIKHIFTHRRLWMQIWELSSSKSLQFLSSNLKFVPLNQLGHYGLPQPIKVLLQRVSLAHGDDLKN